MQVNRRSFTEIVILADETSQLVEQDRRSTPSSASGGCSSQEESNFGVLVLQKEKVRKEPEVHDS